MNISLQTDSASATIGGQANIHGLGAQVVPNTYHRWAEKRAHKFLVKKRVLVIGTGDLAVESFRVFAEKKWRFVVIGLLGESIEQLGKTILGHTVVGSYDQLVEILKRFNIDTVVVCLDESRSKLPITPLLEFKAAGGEILDGHQFLENMSGLLSIDSLRPSALIFSDGFERNIFYRYGKRIIDTVASLLGVAVLLPIFLLVGFLIKLDSAGPVFYRQLRLGQWGRLFYIWKFRSMKLDAEKNGPRWAETNDPRISRVGWWLRKMRLDELPQLLNVIKGDMSLVGPRPERPIFVEHLRDKIPYYDIRHSVRPGITGWAQVKFRYGASLEDSHKKLQYDLYYVKNRSFLLDLKIMLLTMKVIILGEGAR